MSSELRQDLISGEWVIIAPGRGARPHFLDEKKAPRKPLPKANCPFEDLEASGNTPIALYPAPKKTDGKNKDWRIAVISNKYPALSLEDGGHNERCPEPAKHGPYEMRKGIGEHVLVITRDHNKNFAQLDLDSAAAVLDVLQERYRVAAKDHCTKYGVGFYNFGIGAGASVWHPHYQFLATPDIPAHVETSLRRSEHYFKEHGDCARCDMMAFERKEKTRVIFENANAIAIAPYASRFPFEMSIAPKDHFPSFEKTPMPVIRAVAELTQWAMQAIKRLNDPDLNFFIHNAPLDGKPYPRHHWHVEIFPRVSTPAGFEFSTGMYINTTDPDAAAKLLRNEGGVAIANVKIKK